MKNIFDRRENVVIQVEMKMYPIYFVLSKAFVDDDKKARYKI